MGANMRTKTIRTDYENPTLAGALAAMLQNQARFVANLDEDRKRFARIESEMVDIKTLLLQHDVILKNLQAELKDMKENLPEAIREKVGFHKN
jgi:hypothetical protein